MVLYGPFTKLLKLPGIFQRKIKKIPKMDKKTNLFILISNTAVLISVVLLAILVRPSSERIPILTGWLASALNFTAAIVINLSAMRKDFETFKLTVFAGMGIRIGILLALLLLVIKKVPSWTNSFSFSLLLCFGIYIILEAVFFFIKSKQLT